jgi:hypothetical protein
VNLFKLGVWKIPTMPFPHRRFIFNETPPCFRRQTSFLEEAAIKKPSSNS